MLYPDLRPQEELFHKPYLSPTDMYGLKFWIFNKDVIIIPYDIIATNVDNLLDKTVS